MELKNEFTVLYANNRLSVQYHQLHQLIRLFTAMRNKRIALDMIYDFDTLRKKLEKTYPNSKIKFAQNHYRFLKSNGEK